jgi:succinate dehydrogenase / fumarate reductase cytochrome b subunit
MPDVNRGDRPLSPFMIGPYYRPQLTSMTSIFVRITGNGLVVTGLLIVWWFLAAATSPEYFAIADAVLTSWFGDLVLVLSLLAIWYHLLGGLRHLYWDQGGSLDVALAEKMGIGMIAGSVVLTILTVLIV